MKRWLAPLLFALAAASPLFAGPREELLRLAPTDAHFGIVVAGLRDHVAAWRNAPAVARLVGSPLGRSLVAAPELAKLAALEQVFTRHLGVTPEQLRDDLFGDAVVFAFRQAASGKAEQDQGLLLVWARGPAIARGVIDKLNAAQKKSGELRDVIPLEHAGTVYHRRDRIDRPAEFYLIRDNVIALASDDATIREVIDRFARPATEDPPLVKQLRALGVEDCLLAGWLNPRAFDAELTHKARSRNPAEAAFVGNLVRYWNALDAAAVYVRLRDRLEVGVALTAEPARLPPAARRFLSEAAKPSSLGRAVAPEALFAFAGRFDVPSLIEMAGEFLTANARREFRLALERSIGATLGPEVIGLLPQALGPDVGLIVTTPPSNEPAFPPHAVLAVRLRDTGEAEAGAALADGLTFLGRLMVVAHNGKTGDTARVVTVRHDGVEVRHLTSLKGLPPGLRPAFARKDGFLVVGTSPDAVLRFSPGPATTAVEQDGETRMAWMSLAGLGSYLGQRQTELAAVFDARAARRLEMAGTVLALFDRLDLVATTAEKRATLGLRLTVGK